MTRKEVDVAVEWAAQEGWNPGIHDADCYFTADPNGFLIGLLDDEPIATISAINYSFGFIGFYIVKPEHRGTGYGQEHNPLQERGSFPWVSPPQSRFLKSSFSLPFVKTATCG
ncbi:MAG: GNAT family N-acetyltransferase [Candidatus Electrothrix sp. AR5]|nr:GNAT family N-acetyltransferase [Candidatus Electrothrix sp. AR5]